MSLLTFNQAVNRYGYPLPTWEDETKWCRSVLIPADISARWINTAMGKPVQHIYCNIDMASPLLTALQNVRDRGLIDLLKTFDGCFEPRDVRGMPGKVSTHALGLAVDINAATNPLGNGGDQDERLVQCFKDAGFLWGGDFARLDKMHFQFAAW